MRTLTAIVHDYQLEINGVKFWVPYWTNVDDPPFFKGGAFKGKGTPSQLKLALSRRLRGSGPHNVASLRQTMRQFGVGIDCSGFAYYILSHWLGSCGIKLASLLLVDKAELMAAAEKPSWQRAGITSEEISRWPETVDLETVCRRFHKDPRMLTNVKRLTDPRITEPVLMVEQFQPGDLIYINGGYGEHVAVVVEVSQSLIKLADSSWQGQGLGGAAISSVKIIDSKAGLEDQSWPASRIFKSARGDRVLRLKVLNG